MIFQKRLFDCNYEQNSTQYSILDGHFLHVVAVSPPLLRTFKWSSRRLSLVRATVAAIAVRNTKKSVIYFLLARDSQVSVVQLRGFSCTPK